MKPPDYHIAGRYSRRAMCLLFAFCCLVVPSLSYAAAGSLDLTRSIAGILSVAIFVLAYALVMAEELLHMRKSKQYWWLLV